MDGAATRLAGLAAVVGITTAGATREFDGRIPNRHVSSQPQQADRRVSFTKLNARSWNRWNNEGDCSSNDAGGGIGMEHNQWSAGDGFGCCGHSRRNGAMRVEVYGR